MNQPSVPASELKLPETLTLGGVVYTLKDNADLLALVQTVAKIEKSKLYSQIETLKTGLAALQNVQPTPEQNSAPATAGLDLEKFKTELLGTIGEMIKPLQQQAQATQQLTLDEYKAKLLRENSDRCIPELVKGDSKEALDASLTESISIRAKYLSANVVPPVPVVAVPANQPQSTATPTAQQVPATQPVAQQPVAPTPANGPSVVHSTPAPQPQLPQVQNLPTPTDKGLNIGAMSQEEFARRRAELENSLKALVN